MSYLWSIHRYTVETYLHIIYVLPIDIIILYRYTCNGKTPKPPYQKKKNLNVKTQFIYLEWMVTVNCEFHNYIMSVDA